MPNEIIKLYDDILIPYLKHLFNACVAQGIYLKLYRKTKTIVLKKPGKKAGDYIKTKVYRLIALLNTVNKIFEIILTARFNIFIKKRILLLCAQINTKKGRSAQTALKLLIK